MIQRIQSLYLLLASICGILLFLLPFFSLEPGELSVVSEKISGGITGIYQINKDATQLLFRHWPLMLLAGLVIVLQVWSVFQFKKRPLQVKIIGYSLFVLVAFCVFMTYITIQLRSLYPGHVHVMQAGWFLVTAIFLFGLLAIRAIRKDEALVRSADRLR